MASWASGVNGCSLAIEIGFASAPGTAIGSVSWTDVTAYVESLSIDTGRSDELDSYQAGRFTMVLNNADRRFDPNHSAGPYYSNLKPMRRVRVRMTYSATTVTLFSGYISGWPQEYNQPRAATVTVNATDGFAALQRFRLNDTYWHEVIPDTPTYWYRLGESAGTIAVDASGNSQDGTYYGGATFNSRTGLIVGSDNAINFTAGQWLQPPIPLSSVPFTIELWLQRASTGNYEILYYQQIPGTNEAVIVMLGPTGEIVFQAQTTASVLQSITTTLTTAGDGSVHHIVCVCNSGATTPTVYIDGAAASGSTTSGTMVFSGGTSSVVWRWYQALNSGGTAYVDAADTILDEATLYNGTALSAARVLAHYNAGNAPFSGTDTGAAVTTILGYAGWPSADETIETGKSTLTTFDTSGKTALDAIKALETTEAGRFFIAPDGKATFYNRHHTLTTAASTTSQAIFGDAPGELPYFDVEFAYGEDQIRNKVTTQRAAGSSYTVLDATSITNYLEREFSVSGLYNASDFEIRDLGLWLLAHYKDPSLRVTQLVVKARREPTTVFSQVRDRKFTDRITVKRRPQGVGTAISLDALIEGIHHEITVDPLDWTTTYYLSPAETQIYAVLDDSTYGVLGTARLAY